MNILAEIQNLAPMMDKTFPQITILNEKACLENGRFGHFWAFCYYFFLQNQKLFPSIFKIRNYSPMIIGGIAKIFTPGMTTLKSRGV